MGAIKISERTVERLCLYRRVLVQLENKGRKMASSSEIGERADIMDGQVRKDLSLFGQFGVSGRGYNVAELKDRILRILGKNCVWRVAIVGVGNLGAALLSYPQFKKEGFEIVTVFDKDLQKIGKARAGVTIQNVTELVETARRKKIDIGVITVSENAAQETADLLVEAGVKSILNFAPHRLEVPKNIKVRNVDFCLGLEVLTQYLSATKQKK